MSKKCTGLVGIYLGNNEKSALVGMSATVAALVVALITVYRVWRPTSQLAPVRSAPVRSAALR